MTRFIPLLLAGAAASPFVVSAEASTTDRLSTHFHSHDPVHSRDPEVEQEAFDRFDKEVPAISRSAAIVAIWNHAPKRPDGVSIRYAVLSYLSETNPPRVTWDTQLTLLLKEAYRSDDQDLSWSALAIAYHMKLTAFNAEFIAALDDPRGAFHGLAVAEISSWPDRGVYLREYVARHGSDAGHSDTVQMAKAFLDRDRPKGPGRN